MNRINFREIARELNISHTTVYRVINNAHCVSDATRVRVIDALNRHGCYRDARVKPQTVLLDFDENAASSYMRDLLNLLGRSLRTKRSPCAPPPAWRTAYAHCSENTERGIRKC